MKKQDWIEKFPGAITICNTDGIILEMNDEAMNTFKEYGGDKLIGSNVLDCHPEPAKTKLKELIQSQKKNIYTIEKNGTKKLIYQSPWYKDGKHAGIVELSLEIPFEMPHFIRK